MTPIFVAIASAFVTLAACAQDIRFVPGKGPADTLGDTERAAALLAIDTLAADLEVPRESVELDTVRAVEWRDSSLGCPKPGMAYLDVISPGHKVTLRVDGQIERLLKAVDARVGLGNTVVVFTADHGVAPSPEHAAAMRLPGGRVRVTDMLAAVRNLRERD